MPEDIPQSVVEAAELVERAATMLERDFDTQRHEARVTASAVLNEVLLAGYRLVRDDEATVGLVAALLRERHDFPDYPAPVDGEMSTEELWAEQEVWRERWDDLDQRIRAALTAAQGGEDG